MNHKFSTSQQGSIKSSGPIYMILAALLFAIGHALVKWVPHIPFYQLAFLRALITLILCTFFIGWKKKSFRSRNLSVLIFRGLVGTFALTTYFYSLQNMPLASAVTIQHLSPILTLLFSHYFLKEKSQPQQVFSFIIAFIGILMVKGFDERVSFLSLLVSMISVICSAVAYNLVRLSRQYDHEWLVVLYFSLITMLMTAPFALSNWVSPSYTDGIYIIFIGVFAFLAQIFMTMSYHRAMASEVAIYNYLGIFVALGLGYWFFSETFSFLSILGMVVVMIAIFMSYRLNARGQSLN